MTRPTKSSITPNASSSVDITKLNPDLQVVVRLIQSLEVKMDENTAVTCAKIEEKAKEVEALKSEVASLKSDVTELHKLVNAQQYELDNLKFSSNKEFLILSGPGISNTESEHAKIVSATLANKINHRIAPQTITEATKIKIRSNDASTKYLIKFKVPYNERTEITNKLVTVKPNVYVNEALSPLKKQLHEKAKKAKAALPNKIKSVYVKNGILRIKQVDLEDIRKIHNDVELEHFFRELNFEPATASNDEDLTRSGD